MLLMQGQSVSVSFCGGGKLDLERTTRAHSLTIKANIKKIYGLCPVCVLRYPSEVCGKFLIEESNFFSLLCWMLYQLFLIFFLSG